MWMPNEEFGHIIVDNGMFDHHMPDSVQGAIERLYHHQIVERRQAKGNATCHNKDSIPIQDLCSDTETNGVGDVNGLESTPVSGLDDTAKVDGNEDTIKAVDINTGSTEVTIHT